MVLLSFGLHAKTNQENETKIFNKGVMMKKKILTTVLFMTCSIFAVAQQPKVIGNGQKRVKELTKIVEAKNKQLSVDYARYGLFNKEVAKDYMAISEATFRAGDLDTSIKYALFALKVEMKLRKENDPKLAKLYFDTGNKYYMHKEHPTALLYMEKAATIYQNGSGNESLTLADTYEAIASIYINLQDFQKSLEYSMKTLKIRERRLVHSDESVQRTHKNIEFLQQKISHAKVK